MKIEKLTPAQEKTMEEVRQFWLDYIFSCKNTEINREAAKVGIDRIYKMAGLDEPVVIYVDSPLAQQYAVAYLIEFVNMFPKLFKGDQVRDQVGDQVEYQVGDQVRQQVEYQVGDQVGYQVRDQVGYQVEYQVGDQVWDQVRSQVGDQVGEYHPTAVYGRIEDYGWVSFYDFFTQIGVINHKGFNEFKNLLLSGIYDMIQLDGFCIVSSLPEKISRNNQNRLHCEDGPAIRWKDGYELYFWNGVAVPKDWIEHPESITKEVLIGEKNAEKRRCLREIIGNQKFAELLGITEIDRDHVNGQDVVLYRTKSEDDIIGKHIYYVKVICHSTLREYFLCVPETAAGNAWQAVAWTFGMTRENYMPSVES